MHGTYKAEILSFFSFSPSKVQLDNRMWLSGFVLFVCLFALFCFVPLGNKQTSLVVVVCLFVCLFFIVKTKIEKRNLFPIVYLQ